MPAVTFVTCPISETLSRWGIPGLCSCNAGPVSLRTALAKYADLWAPAHKACFPALAASASSESEAARLRHLASAEGKAEFSGWVGGPRRSLLEVLQAFPSVKPSLGKLCCSSGSALCSVFRSHLSPSALRSSRSLLLSPSKLIYSHVDNQCVCASDLPAKLCICTCSCLLLQLLTNTAESCQIIMMLPTCICVVGAFFGSMVPRLQPRFYSISSSPQQCPNSIHVTCAVVMDTTATGRKHEGVCSNYLKRQSVGTYQPYTPCL